jgi:iron(III) transport system substrate-binding protein
MSVRTPRTRALFLPLVAALVALPTAAAATRAAGGHTATPPQHAASAKRWAQIVAKAKQEGSVAIYSSQSPSSLQALADKFKAKYGISVTFNRQNDNITQQQVGAEYGTGKHIADVWVVAAKNIVYGAVRNKWVVQPVGPDLFSKSYKRSEFAKPGNAVVVSTAIASFGWNTSLWPKGIKDYPDFLNPALAGGKIGVVQPSVPGHVDFYRDFITKRYGKNFLVRLAAQKPKIYPSGINVQAGLASGEIAAAIYLTPQVLALRAQGAPVAFKLTPGGSWNSPWWAMILNKAPHPAAAQLLVDYMLTRQGQATINQGFGAVLKKIPGAYTVPLRQTKLINFTPQKVTSYINYWNSLFH